MASFKRMIFWCLSVYPLFVDRVLSVPTPPSPLLPLSDDDLWLTADFPPSNHLMLGAIEDGVDWMQDPLLHDFHMDSFAVPSELAFQDSTFPFPAPLTPSSASNIGHNQPMEMLRDQIEIGGNVPSTNDGLGQASASLPGGHTDHFYPSPDSMDSLSALWPTNVDWDDIPTLEFSESDWIDTGDIRDEMFPHAPAASGKKRAGQANAEVYSSKRVRKSSSVVDSKLTEEEGTLATKENWNVTEKRIAIEFLKNNLCIISRKAADDLSKQLGRSVRSVVLYLASTRSIVCRKDGGLWALRTDKAPIAHAERKNWSEDEKQIIKDFLIAHDCVFPTAEIQLLANQLNRTLFSVNNRLLEVRQTLCLEENGQWQARAKRGSAQVPGFEWTHWSAKENELTIQFLKDHDCGIPLAHVATFAESLKRPAKSVRDKLYRFRKLVCMKDAGEGWRLRQNDDLAVSDEKTPWSTEDEALITQFLQDQGFKIYMEAMGPLADRLGRTVAAVKSKLCSVRERLCVLKNRKWILRETVDLPENAQDRFWTDEENQTIAQYLVDQKCRISSTVVRPLSKLFSRSYRSVYDKLQTVRQTVCIHNGGEWTPISTTVSVESTKEWPKKDYAMITEFLTLHQCALIPELCKSYRAPAYPSE